MYDRRDDKAYVGAKPAFGAGAWCSGRTAAVEAIALEWILFIGGSVRRLQLLSGKCFGAECRQWSAKLGLPDLHGLSVHLFGSRTSGQKRWGLAATALLHILLSALRSFAAVPLLTEKSVTGSVSLYWSQRLF